MKLKRILAACLAVLICLTTCALAASTKSITVDPIDVMVGGKVFLPTDVNGNNVPVFVYNGTTYAPLRAVAEAYGLTVSYNAEKNLGSISGTPSNAFVGTKGTAPALTGRTTLSVSSIRIEVNGQVFQPKDANGKPVDIFVCNGTTYAPLRAVAEAYGLAVSYNQEKRLACIDFVSTAGADFDALLSEVNAARKAEITSPTAFAGYTDYLVNDPDTRNLLTSAEVSALRSTTDREVETVTAEQAISDIDLLFRALHAGYGAYYYFGKDAFDRAEAEVMAWLEGQTTVNVDDLSDVLRKSLSFMVDAHSFVGYRIDRLEGIRYEYHHCTGQQYDKDAQGYFKLINGQRVDFVGFSDDRVTMEPTLLSDGKIVYSPVLFCPTNQVAPATVQLKRLDGTTYTEPLNWKATRQAESTQESKYEFVEEAGIAYISVSSFQDRGAFAEVYERFARTGSQVRNCSALIFDLRSNGGGNSASMYRWVRNFTGVYPQLREAGANRKSVLNASVMQSVYETPHIDKGTWISNDVPVIVLVNDACGSAGEAALNLLKSMDNVLVIGSNSAGYQLGGNAVEINLPHTNIDANIGTQLRFMFNVTNVDCVGYAPDVWCDPDLALDAAFALLVKAGIAEESAVSALAESVAAVLPEIPEQPEPDQPDGTSSDSISLHLGDMVVKKGYNFGIGRGSWTVSVSCNDIPTSDFTVTVADPSVCTVEKKADGTFALTHVRAGSTAITVRCGNTEQTFSVTAVQ